MWKVGDGNRASLTATNAVRANSGGQPNAEAWEYLFVRFNGTSDGNINARTTTFHERVRIVYGPVADWKQEIDPDRVDLGPDEGGWMKCSELTLTQHAKTETAVAYSEVLGKGNVQINGRGFSGVADQVTYDESKGQYILKSFGRRFAMISYQKADGTGMGETSAREIIGHPAHALGRCERQRVQRRSVIGRSDHRQRSRDRRAGSRWLSRPIGRESCLLLHSR